MDIESVLSEKGSDFSVKTTIHIHILYEKFGFGEVFGRSAVMELLGLKVQVLQNFFPIWCRRLLLKTCGWAISTDEGTYTLQMLLDKADSDMYENKQLCKKHNLCSHQGTQK